jgi:hypothetical protein
MNYVRHINGPFDKLRVTTVGCVTPGGMTPLPKGGKPRSGTPFLRKRTQFRAGAGPRQFRKTVQDEANLEQGAGRFQRSARQSQFDRKRYLWQSVCLPVTSVTREDASDLRQLHRHARRRAGIQPKILAESCLLVSWAGFRLFGRNDKKGDRNERERFDVPSGPVTRLGGACDLTARQNVRSRPAFAGLGPDATSKRR